MDPAITRDLAKTVGTSGPSRLMRNQHGYFGGGREQDEVASRFSAHLRRGRNPVTGSFWPTTELDEGGHSMEDRMTTAASKPIRVALYCRVSTGDQDVGLQLDELRSVAQQRGWVISNEYLDEGVSGAKTSRPALDRMMMDARSGRIDLVAVWKLDRLGRSLQHLLRLLDDLQHLGVGFVSVRDAAIDTTSPQGRLLLQVMGAFAEFERSLIVERVRAGVQRAQANGKHCGRPRRELDLRAAQILLGEGHSVRQVAEMLGVPRGTLRRRLAEANGGGSEVPLQDSAENPA